MKIVALDLPDGLRTVDPFIGLDLLIKREYFSTVPPIQDDKFSAVGVKDPTIHLEVIGENLKVSPNDPMSGTVTKVDVADDSGKTLVTYSDFSIDLATFRPGDAEDDKLLRGDDFIIGSNLKYDKIWALEGDDRVEGRRGNDIIRGNEGKDVLIGGEGKDDVKGGEGDDLIRGGSGRDILFGNEGHDSFRFSSVGGSGKDAPADWIEDFSVGEDKIQLQNSFFKGLGPTGVLPAEKFVDLANPGFGPRDDFRILVERNEQEHSTKVFYDPDGTGPKVEKLIVVVFSPLTSSDFLIV